MTTSSNEPNQQDAILGGDAPAPAQAAVLGGLGPVQERLSSSDLETKFTAMKDCLGYGEAGFAELIPLLEDALPRTQWEAYRLLRDRPENSVQKVLKQYRFWQHFEKLNGLPNKHAQLFANRQVDNVEPSLFTQNPITTAYALRRPRDSYGDQADVAIKDQLKKLIKNTRKQSIEALVIGYWCWGKLIDHIAEEIVSQHENLSELKALFLGDIEDQETMISDVCQGNLNQLLSTFGKLEILRIRGGKGLRFGTLSHESLSAITIESGGLGREVIQDLCTSYLPALEYLEIWTGRKNYGSTSTIENLAPIVSGQIFPNLKYLGIRNCEYADDVALVLSRSSPRDSLIELDLSLGTLSDVGAIPLIRHIQLSTSPVMRQSSLFDPSSPHHVSGFDSLRSLNVSQCYLSDEALNYLDRLDISVTCDQQRYSRGAPQQVSARYSVVGE